MTPRYTDSDGISVEDAIKVAKAAGLDTRDLENQANSRGSVEALGERLTALEAEVRKPAQPDPLREYATKLRDAQSKWVTPGEGIDRGE